MLPITTSDSKLIRLPALCDALGVSKGTVYNLIRQGALAKPLKLSQRVSAWKPSDVQDYIRRQEQKRTPEPLGTDGTSIHQGVLVK